MSDELRHYLSEQRVVVDDHLERSLRLAAECPPSLMEAMRYSLCAGGKRLRPLLVLLASEACGGETAVALPAACAVEMVHTYSLIHDDLPAMDDDDLRRGQPTCHKKFGEALAILAGDALLTLAFQVLAVGYPPKTGVHCCKELAIGAGAVGMVGGQVEDLAWEKRSGKLSDLEHIHACKTGALFRACLRMGFWVARGEKSEGRNPEVLENLDAYGRCFGQAFQITDDLLDVEGNAEQTGKRVQKDATRGKLTYPSFLGSAESRRRAEDLCRQACTHLAPLGDTGRRLTALVQLVLERDR
ncbi:MAG: polyprenyl synthetase family protein [Gemmataceae bacterium]|nr:polyprenyl synthetase family protein [Gemmataceae bacterium]